MKACSKCSTVESKKWLSGMCIKCWQADYYKNKTAKNKEMLKKRDAEYYQKNKDHIKERSKAWTSENRDRANISASKWAKNNRQYKNYQESLRRARKASATPPWLTKEQKQEIKNIYMNCPEQCEVDHIFPLKGKESCGLHVPWNLQYLTVEDNRKKGNRLEHKSE